MERVKRRKPNWAIINRISKEKAAKRDRDQYREVEPGVFIK